MRIGSVGCSWKNRSRSAIASGTSSGGGAEDCLGWTSTADPVRRRPEVTRRPFLPANVPEQLGMHLSDEPIAERQFGEALESDLERAD